MMLKNIAERVMGKEFAKETLETTVTKVEEEVLHKTVRKPVLCRGCSVGQFKFFQMDWNRYAKKYSSWFKEQPGEGDEYMINDLLNFELLSCIPAPMAETGTKSKFPRRGNYHHLQVAGAREWAPTEKKFQSLSLTVGSLARRNCGTVS